MGWTIIPDYKIVFSGRIAQRLGWTVVDETWFLREDRVGSDINVRNTNVTRRLEHHKLPKTSL